MSFTKPKNRWLLVLFVLLLLIVGGVIVMFAQRGSPSADTANADSISTPNEVVMTVDAIMPSPAVSNPAISANGQIVGKEIAHVGARINGVAIERVLVDIGDVVKAGQVLAILDNQTATQEVIAAQAQLSQAQANLAKAQADLARAEPLIAIDAISREQYDGYQVAQLQAAASSRAAEANLINTRTRQAHTQVIAPVAGVISERQAEIGMMSAGNALFQIIKDGVLEWQAGVSAYDAKQIALGMPVEINTPNGVATGVVTRIAPVANSSRELMIYATIDKDNQHGLSSGMLQAGKIILGNEQVLALPRRAIMSRDGYDYVWQLSKQGDNYQVKQTKVTLGAAIGEQVAVDLPADTLVVAQGGGFLNEGDLVAVLQQPPTQQNATQNNSQNSPTQTTSTAGDMR